MKELEVIDKPGPMEVDDEEWLDDEIRKELSKINSEELNEDGDEDLETEESTKDNGADLDEVPLPSFALIQS